MKRCQPGWIGWESSQDREEAVKVRSTWVPCWILSLFLGASASSAEALRIRDGEHPLDQSSVHPERYALVEQMAADAGASVTELIQSSAARAKIKLESYVSDEVGLPTLRDIMDELAKPGTYERLEAFAEEACGACQKVLDHHRLPAIAEHTGSLWQILFMTKRPQTQADIMAGDAATMRRLDAECMKRGLYALPGVRRFFSTVHGEAELEDSLRILDDACRAVA